MQNQSHSLQNKYLPAQQQVQSLSVIYPQEYLAFLPIRIRVYNYVGFVGLITKQYNIFQT